MRAFPFPGMRVWPIDLLRQMRPLSKLVLFLRAPMNDPCTRTAEDAQTEIYKMDFSSKNEMTRYRMISKQDLSRSLTVMNRTAMVTLGCIDHVD